jgi:hypothetical protein
MTPNSLLPDGAAISVHMSLERPTETFHSTTLNQISGKLIMRIPEEI